MLQSVTPKSAISGLSTSPCSLGADSGPTSDRKPEDSTSLNPVSCSDPASSSTSGFSAGGIGAGRGSSISIAEDAPKTGTGSATSEDKAPAAASLTPLLGPRTAMSLHGSLSTMAATSREDVARTKTRSARPSND